MRSLSKLASFFVPFVSVLADRTPVYVYVDEWSYSGQAVADEFVRIAKAGASHILLAFHLIDNPNFPNEIADSVLAWSQLDASVRSDTLKQLHDLGTRLIISTGGQSEGDAWLHHKGDEFAAKACKLVKDLGADGIDFDKEGFGFMTQAVSDWNDAAVKKCREVWPTGLITGAPQTPHYTSSITWKYSDGLKNGAGMDHYLIQAYNQGTWGQDTTYNGLFISSSGMAIKEIMDTYPTAAKDVFVVGKPFNTGDAGSGYVDHATLRKFICQAYDEIGYRGGVMFWKHPWGQDISDYTMFAQPCDGSAFSQDPIDGSTSAPTTAPTETETTQTTTTTKATEATTQPTQTTSPKTKPTQATSPETEPSTDGSEDAVTTCKDHISASDPTWQESCESACEFFSGPASKFCPDGATDATALITCVVKQQSRCILGCL